MQPQTFVFFGIVGSGKGTQVKLLQEYLKNKNSGGGLYIGTGEIFRKIADPSSESTPTQKMIKDLLDKGSLIPDDLTNQLVLESLEKNLTPNKDLIFDGYPRTILQSENFMELMKTFRRGEVKIVFIELSKEEAMKRNLLRGRHDDTETGLTQRFNEYQNKVIPSMNYFKDKPGYCIFSINGDQSVEDVHKEIISKLGFN
jgi:adenylate kinase